MALTALLFVFQHCKNLLDSVVFFLEARAKDSSVQSVFQKLLEELQNRMKNNSHILLLCFPK